MTRCTFSNLIGQDSLRLDPKNALIYVLPSEVNATFMKKNNFLSLTLLKLTPEKQSNSIDA